jgi:hypothetical protein
MPGNVHKKARIHKIQMNAPYACRAQNDTGRKSPVLELSHLSTKNKKCTN